VPRGPLSVGQRTAACRTATGHRGRKPIDCQKAQAPVQPGCTSIQTSRAAAARAASMAAAASIRPTPRRRAAGCTSSQPIVWRDIPRGPDVVTSEISPSGADASRRGRVSAVQTVTVRPAEAWSDARIPAGESLRPARPPASRQASTTATRSAVRPREASIRRASTGGRMPDVTAVAASRPPVAADEKHKTPRKAAMTGLCRSSHF
jgi:hypothetical protein